MTSDSINPCWTLDVHPASPSDHSRNSYKCYGDDQGVGEEAHTCVAIRPVTARVAHCVDDSLVGKIVLQAADPPRHAAACGQGAVIAVATLRFVAHLTPGALGHDGLKLVLLFQDGPVEAAQVAAQRRDHQVEEKEGSDVQELPHARPATKPDEFFTFFYPHSYITEF